MSDAPSGLLVLDKPSGVTSYDCVHRVKQILGEKRVGHCGTLDPLAQGVLIVLFGKATRAQDTFLTMEKQYWFRARLGRVTTTGDREGEIVKEPAFDHVTRESLEAATKAFIGESDQIPPRYAALKYNGKPYYKWARMGVEIPRVARKITISSFDFLDLQAPFWDARVVCSRGTYIRTLAEDVAEKVGSGASLDRLVRERVGTYVQKNALSWTALSACSREQLLQQCDASFDLNARHV